ncbi:MAG: SPOR domain-containing protein [Saprospiraceae bacterium]
MKCKNRLFSLAFFLLTVSLLAAQNDVPQYTVQIGSFVNPKPADFNQLRSTGFVYARERTSNHTDVFIGGYTTEREAEKVADMLKTQGYDNAFVSNLNVDGGQSVTIIQIITVRAGDKIDWETLTQAGQLFVLLNGNQIKIVAGNFSDVATAKAQLPNIQKLGFKDAFVKNVNNALLHEVTDFETGGTASKKPLIPLDFAEKAEQQKAQEIAAAAAKKAEEQKAAEKKDAEKPTEIKKEEVPTTYEDVVVIAPSASKQEEPKLVAKGIEPVAAKKEEPAAKATTVKEETPAPKFSMPEIRPDVKRTSALELQKVLKAEGSYKGSLDGYYGKGTRASYDYALATNRQLQKYRILARHLSTPDNNAPKGSLQDNINNLWNSPSTVIERLEASKAPLAKAYRAYFLFVNNGPSKDVNTLMNEAIKAAFANNKAVNLPKFDYTATYAYYDLDQLLTHLRYIHEASAEKVAVPCWLFRKHSTTAMKAFEPKSGDSGITLQNCGGFWEWEEVQLLNAMAQDLNGQGQLSEAKFADSQSELSRLFLAPKALSTEERKALEDWNAKVWAGIDAWASRDPMLAELATALKISYYQTEVLFEDYFMDEGFDAKEAKGLGLAALKALVGAQVERFF